MPTRSGSWLALLGGLWLAAAGARAGSLTGPILDAGVQVEISDLLQLPATAGSGPRARVNQLHEAPDGSGRLFVNDLRGPLYVVDGLDLYTYLDLAAEVPLRTSPNLATGFVSFAFHPEFASNGLFYTVHTELPGATPPNLEPPIAAAEDQHSILTEWQADDPAANTWTGTSRELLRIAAVSTNHNLGEIAFDPTAEPGDADYGLLYLAAGDFGSVATGQPEQLQRLDGVYGALLRIDPLGGPFLRDGIVYDYGIPAGNPFTTLPGALGELYAIGFRNGHRLVWDANGTLFVTDIGESHIEEIDRVEAGDDFGWPEREGAWALDVTTDPSALLPLPPQDPVPYRYPVAAYDHEEGRAIAGGAVYQGATLPDLDGKLVFGDIVNGRLFYVDVDALLAADDGDPATTAPVYELGLEREGASVTLLDLVRAATGNPSLGRTDLRLHAAGGVIHVTTKQDGIVRVLRPIVGPACSNGSDDDGDGFVDYPDDPGCLDAQSVRENPQCQDGVNNDGRTGTDFDGGVSVLGGSGDPDGPDPQCVGQPWRNREAVYTSTGCGLGLELVPALLVLGWLRGRVRARG